MFLFKRGSWTPGVRITVQRSYFKSPFRQTLFHIHATRVIHFVFKEYSSSRDNVNVTPTVPLTLPLLCVIREKHTIASSQPAHSRTPQMLSACKRGQPGALSAFQASRLLSGITYIPVLEQKALLIWRSHTMQHDLAEASTKTRTSIRSQDLKEAGN